MDSIFSQRLNKDNIETKYDCMINDEDLVCYIKSIIHENGEELSSIVTIDFPTLRYFIELSDNVMESDNYNFIYDSQFYTIFSKKQKMNITIPKSFLLESYNILKNIWIED